MESSRTTSTTYLGEEHQRVKKTSGKRKLRMQELVGSKGPMDRSITVSRSATLKGNLYVAHIMEKGTELSSHVTVIELDL